MPLKVTFERLMGEIAEGIAISDPRQPDNPLVYVNPAFCRLTGYSETEALGRNCRFLQGPETDQRELDRLRDSLRHNQPCVVELVNYRKDGTKFWNNLSINPVFDNQGAVIYFTGIQMDVTRRRELEDKQREFVGNLAHELKTPIAAMMGLTDTLERQPQMPEETRTSLHQSIQNQFLRLNQTVENIIELSRIDFQGRSSVLSLIDLRDVVQEAVDGAVGFAVTKGIDLQLAMPQEPASMLGDLWNLSMLVGNLLSNAIKYSDYGGVVKAELTVGGHSCVLQISDQGPGIAPDMQERIFDRFYRIDPSRSRANGGTGLGLAIVKEVARQHGGYVSVASELGKGSVFRVNLPLFEPCIAEKSHG